MQRMLLFMLFTSAVASAADVVEPGRGAGSQITGLQSVEGGGAVLALHSNTSAGLRRLDAMGNTLWGFGVGFPVTIGPLAFTVRSDGDVFVAFQDHPIGAAIAHLDADGHEVARWFHDAPTGRPPILLPDAIVLDSPRDPPRVAAFDFDGTSRGAYALEATPGNAVMSLGARGWPSGRVTVREQHRDANDVPLFDRLVLLDTDMTRAGHYDMAGLLHSERILADGDAFAAGSIGDVARFVRLSPTGDVRWEQSLQPGQGRVPHGLQVYQHPGGLGFLGRARLGSASCVFHGTLGPDGMAPTSVCESVPGIEGIVEAVAQRDRPDGVEVVFLAVVSGEARLLAVRKSGGAPIATRILGWSDAPFWGPEATAIGEDDVLSALSDGTPQYGSRFMRWTAAGNPAVDIDGVVNADSRHAAQATTMLPGGDVLSVASAPGEMHFIRTTAQGALVWNLPVPGLFLGPAVVRAADDGSVRAWLVGAGDSGLLVAISPTGQLQWQRGIAARYGAASLEIDASGSTLVGHADMTGQTCVFARFAADGEPGPTQSLPGSLAAMSVRLADGETVWQCSGLKLVGVNGAVTPVSDECPAQRMRAIAASRWVAAGVMQGTGQTRVCFFDGAQWLRSADIAPAPISETAVKALDVDPAGDAWLVLEESGLSQGQRRVIHARVRSASAYASLWSRPGALQGESLADATGPGANGRVAVLIQRENDSFPLRVEYGLPGQAPDWTVTLGRAPGYPGALLQRTSASLLAAYSPAGVHDGVVFRVAPVGTDSIFVGDFESLQE